MLAVDKYTFLKQKTLNLKPQNVLELYADNFRNIYIYIYIYIVEE